MKPKLIHTIKLSKTEVDRAITNYIVEQHGIFLYGKTAAVEFVTSQDNITKKVRTRGAKVLVSKLW